MGFTIPPTVTMDDLNAFHVAHFGSAPPTATSNPGHVELSEGASAEDGDLGYYSDGEKRTLTDDQIAMFRYSEIQRLLLARQRRREAEAEEASEGQDGTSPAGEAVADTETTGTQNGANSAPKIAADDPYRKKSKFDYKNEHISRQTARRRARELDAVQKQDVELDY